MNEKRLDELLSAYLDEELSPEERLHVESQLEQSAECRETLAHMRQLSSLLKSLPQEAVSEEFASAVMHRAEREHLLASSKTEFPNDSNGPSAVRKRSWLIVLGSVAASAVALLLMVRGWTTPGDRASVGVGSNVASQSREELAHTGEMAHSSESLYDRTHDARAAASAESAVAAMDAAEADSADIEPHSLRMRADGLPPDSSVSPAAPLEARSMGDAVRGTPPGAQLLQQAEIADNARPLRRGFAGLDRGAQATEAQLADVRIGDVLPYLSRAGHQVAVIEVTVVDLQESLGALQVLLASNEIAPAVQHTPPQVAGTADASPSEAPEDNRRRKAAGRAEQQERAQNADPELFAVYVEATESQVMAALNEAQQQELFVDLKLHPPVDMLSLEIASASTEGRETPSSPGAAPSNDRPSDENRSNRGQESQEKQEFEQASPASNRTSLASAVAQRQSHLFLGEKSPEPVVAPKPGGPELVADKAAEAYFSGNRALSANWPHQLGIQAESVSFQLPVQVARTALQTQFEKTRQLQTAPMRNRQAAAPAETQSARTRESDDALNENRDAPTDANREPQTEQEGAKRLEVVSPPVRILFVFEQNADRSP